MSFFRLDRFISLYLVSPFLAQNDSAQSGRIPILMYHSVSDEQEAVHPYYRVNTSPIIFEAHMRYLHENNYTAINLDDLDRFFKTGCNTKSVVITFDDGFHDFYTHAFPLLKKYDFSATVFLPSDYISDARLSFDGKECMTWDEIRQLSAQGIHFGSHSRTHPQLWFLTHDEIEHEIRSSKQAIEDKAGIPVQSFAYPFAIPEDASFINHLREILSEAGYRNGVCTKIGTAQESDDHFFHPRLPVNTDDEPKLFKAKLQGAYDWLGKPQTITKRLKSRLKYLPQYFDKSA